MTTHYIRFGPLVEDALTQRDTRYQELGDRENEHLRLECLRLADKMRPVGIKVSIDGERTKEESEEHANAVLELAELLHDWVTQ